MCLPKRVSVEACCAVCGGYVALVTHGEGLTATNVRYVCNSSSVVGKTPKSQH